MEKSVPITGGRLTLIKSVLDGLPTYMMSLFPIPKSIVKKINRMRRSFIWQGNKEKKGYNLVKWETLTLSRKQGGLGMRNLSIQNNCLLQKWLWRFCTEDGALWRRFIAGKYGLFSQWTTEEVMGSFGCCVWKTIRRLWPQFNNNIYISVGNGLKTDFWNEIWKGDDSLRNLFPNLYTLSLQRSATVAQVWSQQGWNLVFRRALNDWEIENVAKATRGAKHPSSHISKKG
uniref:Putative ovule protein n=1 Tax=Solanum chacoense TaxID=4108 RepID=A0A0V0IIW1_SOLCH